ncbi:outer membrane channel protein TolC [Pseudoalteromonas tunicata]|uniref:Outer membrane channel protein n=1 Tax=Pseudoalteromonas tunicata D2 TaxID=87626 RepID=A4C951_9GAMM|nr:outer membrane channel protein TolC [Pseudoalteromonas tunicata]ATC93618.1 outer membrane channel protein [Pseudoalteromonas tunicata]AXT29453.1 outer membrane channel protein TolC [Pseudoalteromonas tunicata]EAR29116.1 outer membrane channel precursor protein [Pseudoalteromonas tunicata D2]
MKIKLLSALIGLSATFAATSSFAEDLLQVYQIALANDPIVLKAKANKEAQSFNIDRAMSSLLPQLNLTMGYSKSDSNSYPQDEDTLAFYKLNQESDTFSRGITLQQSLFNLSSWNSLNIAEKQSMQAQATYDLAQQQLIVRVTNAYFAVLSSLDDLEFVQAEKRAIERQLEQTKQRYAVGLTARTDVHEAQAQFDNAVAREIVANNNVETSRENLREITGKYHEKLNVLNTTKFSTVQPNLTSSEFIKTAEDKNIQLQVAKVTLDIANEQIEQAKAGHYPTLTLNASYGDSLVDTTTQVGARSMNTNDKPRGDQTSIGLNFALPLYTGGATQAAVNQARAFYVASAEDLEASHRLVSKQVRTSYNQVVSDIATFKALEQAVVSAESALQATEAGFEVGTRTIVDVLLSTRNLFDAKRNLSAVRYRYVISTLSLKQAAGTLSDQDVTAINSGLN